MTTYTSGKAFEEALDWLNQWACSRSFGLGTRCSPLFTIPFSSHRPPSLPLLSPSCWENLALILINMSPTRK